MTDVTINAADGGTFTGYLAKPDSGKGPGIIVAQEIFGVNHVMRQICDDLAAQGYFALCPDLFWRQEPGIQITDKSDEEWAKAFELYKGFSEVKGVEDLIAGLNLLRDVEGCTGSVGALGYCLGGKLAYLMATRSNVNCSVGYYGVGIEKNLDEANAITNPLLLHVAEKDQFVPPEAQEKIKEVLSKIPYVTVHTYPGCDHAFARVGGAHYDKAAADTANQRTATFLAEHLKD
jgi:carboxymethylenebutenolidase